MNPEPFKELLKLGLLDLVDFLYYKSPTIIPIPLRHASHMYEKFVKSEIANNREIEKVYTLSEHNKNLFLKRLGDQKSFIVHLVLVNNDMKSPIEDEALRLQFAFEFYDNSNYLYFFLNCDEEIEIQPKEFDTMRTAFKKNLKPKLDAYISKNSNQKLIENTEKIYIEVEKHNLFKENKNLYFYPTIQTLNIFQIDYIDDDNVNQLFSFGLMVSNEEIEELGYGKFSFASSVSVNDRFKNCPPVCPTPPPGVQE